MDEALAELAGDAPHRGAKRLSGLAASGCISSLHSASLSALQHVAQSGCAVQLGRAACALSLQGLIPPASLPRSLPSHSLPQCAAALLLLPDPSTGQTLCSLLLSHQTGCVSSVPSHLSPNTDASVSSAAAALANACRFSEHADCAESTSTLHSLAALLGSSSSPDRSCCVSVAEALGPVQCQSQLSSLISPANCGALPQVASPVLLAELARVASAGDNLEAVKDELDSAIKRSARKREHVNAAHSLCTLASVEPSSVTALLSGSHELDPAAVTTLRSALSSNTVESASDEQLVALAASARSAGLTDLATKLERTKSRRQSSGQIECSHDCTGTLGAHEDRNSSNSNALSKEQEEAKSLVETFAKIEAIPDSIRRLVNGPAKARWTKELQPALLCPSSTDDADMRVRFVNALRTEGLIRAGAAAELRRNMQAARRAESRRGPPANRVRAIASFAHTFVYESGEPADSAKDDVKRIQGAVKESSADALHGLARDALDGMRQALCVDSSCVLANEFVRAFHAGAPEHGASALGESMERSMLSDSASSEERQAAASVAAEMFRLKPDRKRKRGEDAAEKHEGAPRMQLYGAESYLVRVLPCATGSGSSSAKRLQARVQTLVEASSAYMKACSVRNRLSVTYSGDSPVEVEAESGASPQELLRGVPILPTGTVHFMQWAKQRLEWAACLREDGPEDVTSRLGRQVSEALATEVGKQAVEAGGEPEKAMYDMLDAATLVQC